MTRIVVTEIPESARRDLSIERSILGPDPDLVRHSFDGNEERLISACRNADVDVQFLDLHELLARADIVSLNCRLSSDNEKMIDANAFQQMRRKPVFINCARGRLVDENALVKALDTGQISAAGLDVLSDESADLRTSNMTGRSNVILTPHVGFYSDRSILESRKISASNIRHFLDGRHEDVNRYVYHSLT